MAMLGNKFISLQLLIKLYQISGMSNLISVDSIFYDSKIFH